MREVIGTLLLLFTVCVGTSIAQYPLAGGTKEIQGTCMFSFSQENGPFYDNYGFELYQKDFIFQFEPSVGYFLDENWEVVLQPRLSIDYSEHNSPDNTPNGMIEEIYKTHNYDIGFAMGVTYNFTVSNRFTPFVGAAIGLSWNKYGYDYEPCGSYSFSWSRPDLTVPTLSLGSKIFLSDDCALIPQVQFQYTEYRRELGYYNYRVFFSAGLGLGVYIDKTPGDR